MSLMTRKELIKTVEQRGWEFVRQRGSHAQFKKGGQGTLTIPYHITKNIELSILRRVR